MSKKKASCHVRLNHGCQTSYFKCHLLQKTTTHPNMETQATGKGFAELYCQLLLRYHFPMENRGLTLLSLQIPSPPKSAPKLPPAPPHRGSGGRRWQSLKPPSLTGRRSKPQGCTSQLHSLGKEKRFIPIPFHAEEPP